VSTYKDFGIDENLANLICLEQGGVDYFKAVLASSPDIHPKTVALWLTNDIYGYINADITLKMDNFPLSPKDLASLIRLVEDQYVSDLKSRNVIDAIIEGDKRDPKTIIDDNNWAIMAIDDQQLQKNCEDLIQKYPKEVEQYKRGKIKVMQHFVGEMMRATKGKVSARRVQQMFEKLLSNKDQPIPKS